MKTKIKSLLIVLGFTLISNLRITAQGCFSNLIPGPNRTEIQSQNSILALTLEPVLGPCNITAGTPLTAVGINQGNPKFMLDILCDANVPTFNDVDIKCLTCPTINSVGYRIDSNLVVFTDGDITSAYLGVGAGFIPLNTNASLSSPNFRNTFVGYDADVAFGASGTGAMENTAMGYQALTANVGSSTSYGTKNVAVGAYALETMASTVATASLGNSNTALGWGALELFNPRKYTNVYPNTAVGSRALMNADTGSRNTAEGYSAGQHITEAFDNVAVGDQALVTNRIGNANVAVGSSALFHDTTSNNTAVGYNALYFTTGGANGFGANNAGTGYEVMYHNTTGFSNSATGNVAMFTNTTGNMNVADGSSALDLNSTGDSNVAIGNAALFNNTVSCNTGTGNRALYSFTTGKYNTADGYLSSFGTSGATGDSNASDGALSMYNIKNGNANSAVGYRAGYSITSDTDCLFLGARTDRAAVPLRNAAAIGYHAITTKTNQMEVGNNNADITMGLSNVTPSNNYTRLELNTAYGGGQFNVNWGSTPPAYVNPGNGGTGWSGLRFDDLKATSTPGINPGSGILALDTAGNVIYVRDTGTNGGLIGYCTPGPLPVLAGDAGVNLGTHNFYFSGTSANNPALTDVMIGKNCGQVPLAKLDVLQQSSGATNGSIGIYVENDDTACTSSTFGTYAIGIKSYMPPTINATRQYKIAGWFEADSSVNCCSTPPIAGPQFAIFVPHGGGQVSINLKDHCPSSGHVLAVGGTTAIAANSFTVSDSTVKTDIQPITNALALVKNLDGVSFKYKQSFIDDSLMTCTQYGFISQQVATVIPNLVQTTDLGPVRYKAMSYSAVIPWLVEAIKQQETIKHNDSLGQKLTNDSLRYTLDSLRTAFKSIQNCLNQLCGHGQVHHHGSGNGGSDDSNATIANMQEVTLSAVSGAPLLYQNVPNPFSSGTKINYYLPQNTQGATIAFYDTYGNQMKVVQLSQTGNGTLSITPDNLTSGIYSYSLIVDGKIVDTKRMILQK
jgi:hypothetical protein